MQPLDRHSIQHPLSLTEATQSQDNFITTSQAWKSQLNFHTSIPNKELTQESESKFNTREGKQGSSGMKKFSISDNKLDTSPMQFPLGGSSESAADTQEAQFFGESSRQRVSQKQREIYKQSQHEQEELNKVSQRMDSQVCSESKISCKEEDLTQRYYELPIINLQPKNQFSNTNSSPRNHKGSYNLSTLNLLPNTISQNMSFDEMEQNKTMQSLTKEEKIGKDNNNNNNEYPSNKSPLTKNHLIKVNKVVTSASSTIDSHSIIHLTQIGVQKDKSLKNNVENIDDGDKNNQNERNNNITGSPTEARKHQSGQSGIVFCNVSQNNNIYTSNHDETPSLIETQRRFPLLFSGNTHQLSPLKRVSQQDCEQSHSRRDFEDGTLRSEILHKNEVKKAMKGQFKMVAFFLPKMRKFLETKTLIGKTKAMNFQCRNFIDDVTDFNRGEIDKEFWIIKGLKRIIDIAEQICTLTGLNKIPLFDPENMLKLLINSIIVGYNVFYLFVISLEVFFLAHFKEEAQIFHDIAMVMWVTEMLLQMNTATYHSNTFTTDRRVILKIYSKEYLLFEILPLIFEGYSSENMMWNILIHIPLLLKIKGIMIVLKKLEFYTLQILERHFLLTLFKLCAMVVIFGHVVACSRNALANFEVTVLGYETTWVGNEDEHEWLTRYLECLYWSFAIMMHNLSEKPYNNLEYMFACVAMLLTSIVFGFMLNSIGNILADISKQQEDYRKDLNILSTYMKRKNIDLSLRRKANSNLLKYYHQQSRDKILLEKGTIAKLSHYMQTQITVSANQKVLRMMPFFTETFSNETIQKIYTIMEEIVYAPKQVIFNCQNGFEDSFYLVLQGQVSLYFDNEDIIIQETKNENQSTEAAADNTEKEVKKTEIRKNVRNLHSGDYFGLYSFIAGQNKIVNAQSMKFSQIIRIRRNAFLEILKNNKEDYQKFQEFRDKLLFDQKYSVVKEITCVICGSPDHILNNCPKAYFDKSNIYIFHRYNYSPQQERSLCTTRKSQRQFNPLMILHDLIEKAYLVQRDNDLIDSSHEEDNYTNESDMSVSSSSKDSSNPSASKHSAPPLNSHHSKDDKSKRKKILNQRQSTNPFKTTERVESLILPTDSADDMHVDVIPQKQETHFISSKTIQPKTVSHSSTIEVMVDSDQIEDVSGNINTPNTTSMFTRKKSHILPVNTPSKRMRINSDQDCFSLNIGNQDTRKEQSLNIQMPDEKQPRHRDKLVSSSSMMDPHILLPSRKSIIPYDKEIDVISQQIKDTLQNNKDNNPNNNTNNNNSIVPQTHKQRMSLYMPGATTMFRRLIQTQDELDDIRFDDYFEWKFEKMQTFDFYYTRFNYLNVLKRFNNFLYTHGLKRKRTIRQKTRKQITHSNPRSPTKGVQLFKADATVEYHGDKKSSPSLSLVCSPEKIAAGQQQQFIYS